VVVRRGRLEAVCARGACPTLLGGPSTSPLDIARAMASLRRIAIVAALALAGASASALDLGGYSVVKLHRGLNDVDLGVAGRRDAVVIDTAKISTLTASRSLRSIYPTAILP
jgi:hypothetical protein